MTTLARCLLAFLLFSLCSCSTLPAYHYGSPSKDNSIQNVSMINLIATPERYEGKLVRVNEYVTAGFEVEAIWFGDHAGDPQDALWLDLNDELLRDSERFDCRYCLVEGIFTSQERGHMGAYSGTIKNVGRLMVWW